MTQIHIFMIACSLDFQHFKWNFQCFNTFWSLLKKRTFWSITVQFGPISFTVVHQVHFSLYKKKSPLRCTLVHMIHLGLRWSIRFILVKLIHFSLIWSIQVHHGLIWFTSVHLLKNEKRYVQVESAYSKFEFIKKYKSQTHSKFY